MGKRSLKTDAEVKAEVDGLLGQFGVVGEADPSFDDEAQPKVKNGEQTEELPPSADSNALWK
ncbi:MAG: hypothetical protein QM817_21765 [Archangium sp.]